MLVRRLTIALAALGVLGSPVAALYCGGDDPAAMACCQRDSNDCNQPAKNDDCCRPQPPDGQALAVKVKAGDLAKPQSVAGMAAVLPATVLPVVSLSAVLSVRHGHVPRDLPLPPPSVLRI